MTTQQRAPASTRARKLSLTARAAHTRTALYELLRAFSPSAAEYRALVNLIAITQMVEGIEGERMGHTAEADARFLLRHGFREGLDARLMPLHRSVAMLLGEATEG